jgi:hypothetical protein
MRANVLSTGMAGVVLLLATAAAAAPSVTTQRDLKPVTQKPALSVAPNVIRFGNLTPIQVPESDLQRLEIPIAVLRPAGLVGSGLEIDADQAAITVNRPNAEDSWIAGTTQPIRWNSTDVQGAVKIDLVHAVSAQQYDFYPISAVTENDGAYDYLVPGNLNCGWSDFYLQLATLDDSTKAFSPPLKVYHEPVDMTGMIVDLRQVKDVNQYVDHKSEEWLKLDVWFRNNGTQQSTTVQTIRVIVIKEPEEVVVDGGHVEFGFSNMAPRLWYSTPDPLKFKVSRRVWGDETVNMEVGTYRVEVTIDPLNLLEEGPAMLDDNHFLQRFEIRDLR